MSPWASPSRGVRLAMMTLTGVALVLAATAFAYAVIANQRASEKAQRTASQAGASQLYAIQLFCTQLRSEEADRDTSREWLVKLEHYDAELGCDAALAKPLVPLGKTGAHPAGSPTPRPSARAVPTASASVRSPPPSRSTQRPSPSPSPSPSVCVTVGPVHRCLAVGASGAPPRWRGRHFGREFVLD